MKDTRFKPGNPGRKPGSKNKSRTREELGQWIDNNWQRFDSEMKAVKGAKFCELFLKVLPFRLPQYSAVNFSLAKMSETDLEIILTQLKQHEQESTID